jgi:hypothetical protein
MYPMVPEIFYVYSGLVPIVLILSILFLAKLICTFGPKDDDDWWGGP